MWLSKNTAGQLQIHLSYASFYLICHIIFVKLSELRQISCVIPHEVEIQASLYQAKF